MNTQPFGPFMGINNRRSDFEMVSSNGQFLKSADNVEIDNAGRIKRRKAESLLQALTMPHSIFMVTKTSGFFVLSSWLYAVTLPAYTQTQLKLLSSNAPMTYEVFGDSVYYSNGVDSGRITGGAVFPIGLPTPAVPTVSDVAGGQLLPSLYQVAVSYARYSGSDLLEEGGISPSYNHELTTNDTLRVALPGALAGATHVNVYVSGANGSVPMLMATLPVSTASYDCSALVVGREAQQRYEDVLPAGELFMSNGRLCSIVNADTSFTVYVGLPFRPGYYLPEEAYIPFPKAVSIAIENQGGTYIATTDQTFWFPGDLVNSQDVLSNPLPYGAVHGTAFKFPHKSNVGWFGAKGFVIGKTSGEVEAVMSDNIILTPPASGFSTVFEGDPLDPNNYRRVVSCGWCMNLDNYAATTYSGWGVTSASGGYGTKPDGIYALNSDGLIDAAVGFGRHNFSSEFKKYLPNAYAGVDSDTPMQLRVQAPGDVDYTYDARSNDTDLKIQRFDLGRGLLSNWFEFTLFNTEGSDFTLATMSFAAIESSRRI